MKARNLLGFLTTMLLGTALISLGVVSAGPPNVLVGTDHNSMLTAAAASVPQSWPFFTKDPKEPSYVVFRSESGEEISAFPQLRLKNIGGLSRNQRAQGPEVAMLHTRIPEFVDCAGAGRAECLQSANSAEIIELSNPATLQTICGDVVIGTQTIVPFAYRALVDTEDTQLLSAARVFVECEEGHA